MTISTPGQVVDVAKKMDALARLIRERIVLDQSISQMSVSFNLSVIVWTRPDVADLLSLLKTFYDSKITTLSAEITTLGGTVDGVSSSFSQPLVIGTPSGTVLPSGDTGDNSMLSTNNW